MPGRPRVVADSNVIISAFHGAGNPRRVLLLANTGKLELFHSPFIVDEVARILAGRKFRWPLERVAEAIAGLPGNLVLPTGPPIQVARDETDNRILESAVAARADYLVTGDRHLVGLTWYLRTRILTPRAFLDAIGH